MSESQPESAQVERAVLSDRVESWDWFLQLLEQHGYKDQPIWDEALGMAREVRAERRKVLRRKPSSPPG